MRDRMESVLPAVVTPLLHERDAFMIDSLRRIDEKRVVGIVGLAHLDGIEAHWSRLPNRLKELGIRLDDLKQWK